MYIYNAYFEISYLFLISGDLGVKYQEQFFYC